MWRGGGGLTKEEVGQSLGVKALVERRGKNPGVQERAGVVK